MEFIGTVKDSYSTLVYIKGDNEERKTLYHINKNPWGLKAGDKVRVKSEVISVHDDMFFSYLEVFLDKDKCEVERVG